MAEDIQLQVLMEASAQLRAELALNPEHAAARLALGKALMQMRRDSEAESVLEEYVARWPESESGQLFLALARVLRGRVAFAIEELRSADARCRQSSSPQATDGAGLTAQSYASFLSKAETSLADGALDDAAAGFLLAAAYDPEQTGAVEGIGMVCAQKGWTDVAEACFRHALSLSPDRAETLANLGGLLILSGRNAEALNVLKRAVDLDPAHAHASRNLVQVALAVGDFQEAVRGCEALLTVDPDDAIIHYAMGVGLFGVGRIDAAISAYRRSIELAPAFPNANANLAALLHSLDRWDEAVTVCSAAMRQDLPAQAWIGIQRQMSESLFARIGARAAQAASAAPPTLEEDPALQPPSPEIVIRRCRHGSYMIPVRDEAVGRSLAIYGEWSEHEVALFREIVKPGMTALDIGANIGAITLPLARMVGPDGVVIAVEPQQQLWSLLAANCLRNSANNVKLLQLALGRADGMLATPAIDFSTPGNYGGQALGSGESEVPVRTLDSLDLGACDFIKIDVEGMELDVLLGATKTIERFHPVLYVENDRPAKSFELISRIMEPGYHCWWHLPPLYNPRNWAGETESLWLGACSSNMLCLPAGSTAPLPSVYEVLGPKDRPERLLEAGQCTMPVYE
jgi:FkbM family methyltransferase